ncbi:DUF7935 family protein [Microscilla marina]|uniref:Uncharacterized protein n=1 Tax=Microscilla marina ATCC 23134 TaxID=313606 RepID=A1ZGX9_MICM2|nr:hypothetical protein [Microscilla marina]EAY30248.1 hypothetical protein M23134_08072 [Microscilla marina ATCC 23134]
MDAVIEIIKITLPAGLVLYGMFLVIRSFANKELNEKYATIKAEEQKRLVENRKESLPIRLQSYERICLLLERISPGNLIRRLHPGELVVGAFQQVLLNEINNELNHNLSQQLYMSDTAWGMVKQAVQESIMLVNNSAAMLEDEAPGIELAKKVLENAREHEINPTAAALAYVKDEARGLF